MSKGVLKVTVPKSAQTKKIDIKAGGLSAGGRCAAGASGALSNASGDSEGFFSV
jgi:hypothetical protein